MNMENGLFFSAVFRLIAPAYHDGIDAPRQGYDGLPLPSARLVTQRVHFEENFNEHAATTMVVSFGQFMDHDFTLTGTILGRTDASH